MVAESFGKADDALALMARTRHVAVGVEFRRHQRLTPKLRRCALVGTAEHVVVHADRIRLVLPSADFRHVIRPAVMEREVAVRRPDVRRAVRHRKLVLLLQLAVRLCEARAEHRADVRGFLMDDIGEMREELADLLVGEALIMREPRSAALMVDADGHAPIGAKHPGDLAQFVVGEGAVERQREGNILPVAANIPHLFPRLTVGIEGEIIIIRIVPLEGDVHVLARLGNALRPLLIVRVVGIHDAYGAVRTSELMQDVVLIDVLRAFAAVAEVKGALGCTQMELLHGDVPLFSSCCLFSSNLARSPRDHFDSLASTSLVRILTLLPS